MSGYGLYHSFPRSHRAASAELAAGLATLRSLMQSGLVLAPERIVFPLELGSGLNWERGTAINQARACFTFLSPDELNDHAARFGAFTLEFDVDTLRAMGAFPVVYVPQPVRERSAARPLSLVGNSLVHQLRDISVLLHELIDLEEQSRCAIDPHAPIALEIKGQRGYLNFQGIQLLLEYLLGDKGSFRTLLNYTELLANMFYHADSARPDQYVFDNDLSYYSQREWRIVSGFLETDMCSDRELAAPEIAELQRISPSFRSLIELRSGAQVSRANACRILESCCGVPFWTIVRRFHIPDVVYDQIGPELTGRGVPTERILPLDYETLQAIRMNGSTNHGR